MRLGIVTDIHHGPDHGSKLGSTALGSLEAALAHFRRDKPDLVVDLGDRITDLSPAEDRVLMAEVAERFRALGPGRRHLIGNHDEAFLTRAENAAILGADCGNQSLDLEGYRLIFWQPNCRRDPLPGDQPLSLPYHLAPGDLGWLARALAESDRPCILFSHLPVSGQSLVGNYYFELAPQAATYSEAAEIREVAEASEKVVLWVSGHVHWNSLHQAGGIPHLTLQSMAESFTSGGQPSGAYADLVVADKEIRLTVHGNDPLNLTLPIRRGPRWPKPRLL